MKSFHFDTCVLIAGSISDHAFHEAGRVWYELAVSGKIEATISTHTMAEYYSALTRMSASPSLSPDFTVHYLCDEVLKFFKPVALVAKDYRLALQRTAAIGRKGGAIYDALHIEAALKIKADGIVTFNEKDFIPLIGSDKIEIVNPLRGRG